MSEHKSESGEAVRCSALVRPRTITLSENVRQESPVGFMVFAHNDLDSDYMIFPDWHEAQTYAMKQEEKANAPDDSWPIYALWASEWPNAIGEARADNATPPHGKTL